MQAIALLLIGLAATAAGPSDYDRSFGAKALDQAVLDAEGFGEKKAFKREDGGLRVELAAGVAETGWKTPPQIRFGGDFTISASFVLKKLPKPALEDGVAVGLAIAFGDVNQPDLALVRLLEPNGTDVYRAIEKDASANQNPMQMQMQMMAQRGMIMGGMPPGGKPPKPPRRTSPAAGDSFRLEIVREGSTIRYQVADAKSAQPRYLGQLALGPNDVAALKLFVTNRNGAEAVNVLLTNLSIRADRINGLGTTVRSVYDAVVYGEPTSIEGNLLIVGGTPKNPPPDVPTPAKGADFPEDVFAKTDTRPGEKKGEIKPSQTPAQSATAASPAVAQKPAQAQPAAAAPQAAPAAANAQKPPEQKPKAKLPLDEVESIRFERTPMMAARFVGQPNLDFTKPGLSAKKDEKPKEEENKAEVKKEDKAKPKDEKKAEAKKEDKAKPKEEEKKAEARKEDKPKAEEKKESEAKPKSKDEKKKTDGTDDVLAPPPGTAAVVKHPKVEPEKNGIRDLQLSLSGLRPAKIKQITVNGQTDKGPAAWRLDTSDSQDWPLVALRSGTEMAADLFLEPPAGDCHQKDFNIVVNYEDGQMGNATVKITEHTDPKLAIDPKAPASPKPDVWLYLAGDEKLFGKLDGIGTESVKVTTPWQDHLDVPMSRIVGLHLGLLNRKETPESFAKRLKEQGAEDRLLAQTKTGEVIAIAGILEEMENDKLRFRFQNRSRTLPMSQVEGIILAARRVANRQDELQARFALAGGMAISGRWKDLDTKTWKVVAPWNQELNLPAADVQSVRFQGGRMTYLSDLKPGKVEEVPFFGHRLPWKSDLGLMGGPLKVNGQTFERGIAVHSRCFLTYDLGGRYSTFEATLGFDEAAKGKGRVDCRVVADGKELYANPDLRADGPPVKLKLPVEKVEQLRLLVDYGRGQDAGDRVIWGNARLYREPPPKVADSAASPSPRPDNATATAKP